mmetsp:Transcript_4726/g.14307  ORF Transcript_4726/g.14307 Transcript_4726/m.14307 type:complete len:221 (-) Transcript_4726:175-837(-)
MAVELDAADRPAARQRELHASPRVRVAREPPRSKRVDGRVVLGARLPAVDVAFVRGPGRPYGVRHLAPQRGRAGEAREVVSRRHDVEPRLVGLERRDELHRLERPPKPAGRRERRGAADVVEHAPRVAAVVRSRLRRRAVDAFQRTAHVVAVGLEDGAQDVVVDVLVEAARRVADADDVRADLVRRRLEPAPGPVDRRREVHAVAAAAAAPRPRRSAFYR